ncbi:pyrimidine utilization protein D [Alteromonas sp. 14N.309.X.WAT.G.H12]|uniref:pyrimidine utilization protein D n=1 Tax=Alteromonas sp. 14N.309.X.WAT.G.H12 TaxID=3120824 RepID=UPI002FD73565
MYFEVHGLTTPNAPTLVLSSGLGGAAQFWQPQLADLVEDYRVIVYDQLGTNRSPATLPSDYRIVHMADELLTLLDKLDVSQCHLIGHALGGLVGLELAKAQPERLTSLVLINAWSSPNSHTQRCFNIRKALLASGRKDIYLQMQALLLYPPDWIVANQDKLTKEEAHHLANFPDKNNLLARIQALSMFDIDPYLGDIHTPTLVIANKDDMLVPWQRSQILVEHMPNASLTTMEYGGHACSITVPTVFNRILHRHLNAFA